MYRKVTCLGCGYVQEDSLTYYQHKKIWNANHSLAICKKKSSVFANLFGQTNVIPNEYY